MSGYIKIAPLLIIATTLLFLASCNSGLTVTEGEKQKPTTEDVASMAPGGLKIPVTNYQWVYLSGHTHIQVSGEVQNDTGQPQQSIRLSATLHDQNGNPVANGTSFVAPSYLPPGAKGTFEFVAMTSRERGITHTRLVSSAQTLR